MHPGRPLIALAVFAAVLSALVALATGTWMSQSDIPGFGGEEANVVYSVQQLTAGEPIYSAPDRPPYAVTQYSPIYYIVCASATRLVGVEATDAAGVTRVCRLVSLAAALACAVVVFALVRVSLRLPVAVGVMIAAFGLVAAVPWHFLARPDALTTLFLLLALFLALRVNPSEGYRPWSAAAAIFVAWLALLTKQSGAQAGALVLLYLAFVRAWRELGIAVGTGAAVAAVLVALAGPLGEWLGPAFKEHLIDGVRNGMDPVAALERTFAPFFQQFWVLAALAAVAGVALWREADPRRRFVGAAPVFLFAFACATGFKVGSAANYFIEFAIVAAISSGVYCCATVALRPLAIVSLMMYLPFASVGQFEKLCYTRSLPRTLRPDPRYQFQAVEEVAMALREELQGDRDAYVLTRECFSVGNLLFPHTVTPQPRIAEISHARGLVDYTRLRADVAEGRVRYVVTRAGERPTAYLGARFEKHRLVRTVGGYSLYALEEARETAQR